MSDSLKVKSTDAYPTPDAQEVVLWCATHSTALSGQWRKRSVQQTDLLSLRKPLQPNNINKTEFQIKAETTGNNRKTKYIRVPILFFQKKALINNLIYKQAAQYFLSDVSSINDKLIIKNTCWHKHCVLSLVFCHLFHAKCFLDAILHRGNHKKMNTKCQECTN